METSDVCRQLFFETLTTANSQSTTICITRETHDKLMDLRDRLLFKRIGDAVAHLCADQDEIQL
jgi:predicted oxidoreductase (fatty acid repression mutant protein)